MSTASPVRTRVGIIMLNMKNPGYRRKWIVYVMSRYGSGQQLREIQPTREGLGTGKGHACALGDTAGMHREDNCFREALFRITEEAQ